MSEVNRFLIFMDSCGKKLAVMTKIYKENVEKKSRF